MFGESATFQFTGARHLLEFLMYPPWSCQFRDIFGVACCDCGLLLFPCQTFFVCLCNNIVCFQCACDFDLPHVQTIGRGHILTIPHMRLCIHCAEFHPEDSARCCQKRSEPAASVLLRLPNRGTTKKSILGLKSLCSGPPRCEALVSPRCARLNHAPLNYAGKTLSWSGQ